MEPTDIEKIQQILAAHGNAIAKLIENQKYQQAYLEKIANALLGIAVTVRQEPGAGPEAN